MERDARHRRRAPRQRMRARELDAAHWLGLRSAGRPQLLRPSENVFVTGGALWPKGGSYNPTLAMVALAMDLVDKLVPKKVTEDKVTEDKVTEEKLRASVRV